MRVLLQRVKDASVTVDEKLISSIKKGYLLLVGIQEDDNTEKADYLARKIAKLRVFPDEDGKMNKSILEANGEILAVSQFTLYGDITDGNRPSFTKAMEPVGAKKLFDYFVGALDRETGRKTLTGIFGAHMEVNLVNDGPVTIICER